MFNLKMYYKNYNISHEICIPLYGHINSEPQDKAHKNLSLFVFHRIPENKLVSSICKSFTP